MYAKMIHHHNGYRCCCHRRQTTTMITLSFALFYNFCVEVRIDCS